MVRWKLTGTNNGPYLGFAATGRKVSNDGIGIYTFKNGKIIHATVHTDRLGFLQALGVLPSDPGNNVNRVFFIDKFVIPATAREEFMKRAGYNRNFIKTLPGFIHDNAYESKGADGNILITTIAVWEDESALLKAKKAVQAEYKRINFDPAEMTRRLGITMDRAIYKALD